MDRFIGVNIWRDDCRDIGNVYLRVPNFEIRRVWPSGWVIVSSRGTVVCAGEDWRNADLALAQLVTLAKEGTV